MKINRNVIVVVSLILFQSCISENEQKGIKLLEPLFKTNNIIVSHGFKRSTNGQDINFVGIKVKNSPIANDPNIGIDGTISIAAIIFYENMSQEEKAKYTTLKMEVEQMIGGVGNNVETYYSLSDLEKVGVIGETFRKALDNLKDENAEEFYNLLDDKVKSNMPIDSLKVVFQVMNSSFGNVIKSGVRGFKFEEEKLEDGEKMRTIHFWAGLERTKMTDGNKHIVDIWFNDKKKITGVSF